MFFYILHEFNEFALSLSFSYAQYAYAYAYACQAPQTQYTTNGQVYSVPPRFPNKFVDFDVIQDSKYVQASESTLLFTCTSHTQVLIPIPRRLIPLSDYCHIRLFANPFIAAKSSGSKGKL